MHYFSYNESIVLLFNIGSAYFLINIFEKIIIENNMAGSNKNGSIILLFHVFFIVLAFLTGTRLQSHPL